MIWRFWQFKQIFLTLSNSLTWTFHIKARLHFAARQQLLGICRKINLIPIKKNFLSTIFQFTKTVDEKHASYAAPKITSHYSWRQISGTANLWCDRHFADWIFMPRGILQPVMLKLRRYFRHLPHGKTAFCKGASTLCHAADGENNVDIKAAQLRQDFCMPWHENSIGKMPVSSKVCRAA